MYRRVLVLWTAFAFALAGCGGASHPHHATPAPAKPVPVSAGGVPSSQAAPTTCRTAPDGSHYMGACAPTTFGVTAPPTVSGLTGPDLSNNDPLLGLGHWQAVARAHHPFEYNKVAEYVNFRDAYAASMGGLAARVGIYPGGYLFVHLCQGSPTAQGVFFVHLLVADRLLGPRHMPPVLDVEYPQSTGCSAAGARQFILTIVHVVQSKTHEQVGMYTGAWYSNPKLGCWWPQGVLAWVSGYVQGGPPRPCGLHRQEDIWQYTDKGFNGSSSGDMNLWRHSRSSLDALAHASSHATTHHKRHRRAHAKHHKTTHAKRRPSHSRHGHHAHR